MKREEKNLLTKGKILDSALAEFARKGYEGASLNSVCASGGISKGIIYHYFADKDELYLACVSQCFEALSQAVERVPVEGKDTAQGLRAYFEGREAFFAAHPACGELFCSATSNPPLHLRERVAAARSRLDSLSRDVLIRLLQGARLRPGIGLQDVAEEFRRYQDFFNQRARDLPPRKREAACRMAVDILLYGVIEDE